MSDDLYWDDDLGDIVWEARYRGHNPHNIPRPNDDLWTALEYHEPQFFTWRDIEDIVAEVPGENDEFDWWWILKLKDGKYALFAAGCDFTGWDCQSWITYEGIFDTPKAAAYAAPIREKWSGRYIRENLIGQVEGRYPKFTYWTDGEE